MRGEHLPLGNLITHMQGSSPHARGARQLMAVSIPYAGIIPACAGSTNALA